MLSRLWVFQGYSSHKLCLSEKAMENCILILFSAVISTVWQRQDKTPDTNKQYKSLIEFKRGLFWQCCTSPLTLQWIFSEIILTIFNDINDFPNCKYQSFVSALHHCNIFCCIKCSLPYQYSKAVGDIWECSICFFLLLSSLKKKWIY